MLFLFSQLLPFICLFCAGWFCPRKKSVHAHYVLKCRVRIKKKLGICDPCSFYFPNYCRSFACSALGGFVREKKVCVPITFSKFRVRIIKKLEICDPYSFYFPNCAWWLSKKKKRACPLGFRSLQFEKKRNLIILFLSSKSPE